MAIHRSTTPKREQIPRKNGLANRDFTQGYPENRGLSAHSGRQGRTMRNTPSRVHISTRVTRNIRRAQISAGEGCFRVAPWRSSDSSPLGEYELGLGASGLVVTPDSSGRSYSRRSVVLQRTIPVPLKKPSEDSTTSERESAHQHRGNRCWRRRPP